MARGQPRERHGALDGAQEEARPRPRADLGRRGGRGPDAAGRSCPAAAAFWELATTSYRKVAENRVVTAKREATRESRLAQLIEDSAAGVLIKSQRYGETPKWVARAAEAAREAAREQA